MNYKALHCCLLQIATHTALLLTGELLHTTNHYIWRYGKTRLLINTWPLNRRDDSFIGNLDSMLYGFVDFVEISVLYRNFCSFLEGYTSRTHFRPASFSN